MLQKPINRRDFIHSIGKILFGILLLPWTKWIHSGKQPSRPLGEREAKFYRSSDRLAG